MASVDKVKIGSTSYDISPSSAGTLKSSDYTSSDAASPASFTAVNVISTSDTQSTIFSKITTMVKNIRFLYSLLGTSDISSTGQTTVTGALNGIQSSKAASSHSHTVSDLPISSTQVNSTGYIPTSSLIYAMNTTLSGLSGKNLMGENVSVNVTSGGIASGTTISSTESIQSIVRRMVHT